MVQHKIDYDTVYKIALEKNSKEVRDAVLNEQEDMLFKISNYSEKYNIPKRFLIHQILRDPIFANQFAKDPAKQSIHQKTAAEYIENITGVEDFCQLPAGGQNAVYICKDGCIHKGSRLSGDNVKSIDFHWTYDGKEYYAAHKYTKDEGGAQDNQCKDLMDFLSNASKSKMPNVVFFAIGDGAYYQRGTTENGVRFTSRIKYMNDVYSTENALAITTDDLEDYLIGHSSNRTFES